MSETPIERTMRLAAEYGVSESNPIAFAEYDHTAVDYSVYCAIDDPDLVRVDRFRLLTDPGFPFYDISYVWGTMKDGTRVRVSCKSYQFPRACPGHSLKSRIVDWAIGEGVNAKRLGIFDAISLLN